MIVMVTGARGQLGFDLMKRLQLNNIPSIGVDIDDFDITNRKKTIANIEKHLPDTVIHCAAYTLVDQAEEDKERCYDINVIGTENVVEACTKIHANIVYISTDYVFGGYGVVPYETDSDKLPTNYYGLTKSIGEEIVKRSMEDYSIVRTSWLYGINGKNFVKTMLNLGENYPDIAVVDDQFGSPTYSADLASLLVEMLGSSKYGIYHATNEGYCSWFDFARHIMKVSGLACEIKPVSSENYLSRATRPSNSRMSKASLDAAGFRRLPPWDESLRKFMMCTWIK